MMRSSPSSVARRAASGARMPQSTETTTPGALGVQALDRRRLEAIAVAQPLRDEVPDVAAQQLEGAAQDDGRRDAVDVVVAVDDHALPVRDRRQQPLDGRGQVGEPPRIDQVIERRPQEAGGLVGVVVAADGQQAGDDRRHAELGGEPRRRRFIAGPRLPDQGWGHRRGQPSSMPMRPIARNFW